MRLMNNFITENGTLYEINPINKTIVGGRNCPYPMRYQSLETRIGEPAFIILENGTFLKTSKVEAFNVKEEILQKQITEVKTKNSTYYFDYENMTVHGGKLSESVAFLKVECRGTGFPAFVNLQNGQYIRTSPVIEMKQTLTLHKDMLTQMQNIEK